MSKMYKIEIEEVLQKIVKIKANSLNEAINIAQERYEKEEYVLDYNDYKSVDIRQYDNENIKGKSKFRDKNTR